MKKSLTILLTLVLLFCSLPTVSFGATIADSGYCGGEGDGKNLTWTLDSDGTLTIKGTGKMGDYSFSGNYPEYYTTAPWGGSVSNANRIKKVIIDRGVTSIGSWAFRDCKSMISVSIGTGMMSIGSNAFFTARA